MSASADAAHRRDLQRMLVGADALDRAHGARAEAGAGAVGDAEVHRHADQRHVEAGEIGSGGRRRPEGRAEQGRRIGERPFAPVGAVKIAAATARNAGSWMSPPLASP